MVDKSQSESTAGSSLLAYRLVAMLLIAVAVVIAVLVVQHSLAGYQPDAPACHEALAKATSVNDMPASCNWPLGQWAFAGLIFVGGLWGAGKAWSRR